MRENRLIPWPGPRPYDEHEWRFFYGRNDEISEVRRRLSAEKLTILTGRSGTGKTSVLRAGLVPSLRLRRLRGTAATPWPVLLLRDWGAGQEISVRGLVQSALRNAVEGLATWGEEWPRGRNDADFLRTALAEAIDEADLLEVFDKLVSGDEGKIEGLILVFDQLEEVLRLGEGAVRETVDLLRDLFVSNLPVRLLLSLREEYLSELRGLERAVGGLLGRTVFLRPMARQTAQDVVRSAAADAHFELDEAVVEMIFSWLHSDTAKDDNEKITDAVDLLTLQAVLRELFADFTRHQATSDSDWIDLSALNRYRERYGANPVSMGREALMRWIAGSFERPELEDGRTATMTDIALAQRLAVRIAPHMSSAGYKIAQEESDLFRKAAGDDIAALGLRDPAMRGKLRLGEGGRLDLAALELGSEVQTEGLEHLSGPAYERRSSRAATAQALADGFLTALELLRKRNVVKPSFSFEGTHVQLARRWELVHDGLGRPLSEWAEQWRDTWQDCAASLVACRGLSPLGIRPDRVPQESICYARWEGCQVTPISGNVVVLEGIDFVNCALRGTIFQRIRFQGCRFIDCELSGVVFLDCTFERGARGPVRFERCRPDSMAFVKCTLSTVDFQSCRFVQLTVRATELVAVSQFTDCVVTLSNFVDLRRQGTEAELLFDPTCILSFCSADPISWSLLRFECPISHSAPQEMEKPAPPTQAQAIT